MNKNVYINDINNILEKCNSNLEYENNNKNKNNDKIPFALKKFKSMYGQFLYRKEVNKKYTEVKKIETKLINSFDDIIDENYEKWSNLNDKLKLNCLNEYITKNKIKDSDILIKKLNDGFKKGEIIYDYKKKQILKIKQQ